MGCAERLEQDLGVARSHLTTRLLYGRPARRVLVGSEQAGHQKRQVLHQASHAQQEVERRGIRPVQIVEHDHRRHQVGAGREVAPGRPGDVVDQCVTLQGRDRLYCRVALDGEHYLEKLQVALWHRAATGITMQSLAYGLRRLAFLGADRLADHLPPGIIGDGLLIGECPPLEPGNWWLGISRRADFRQQSRLAQSRFADHRHERATSLANFLQLVVHEPEFSSATYQRRGQSLALETSHLARHDPGRQHLIGLDGCGLAFDLRGATRLEFEELLDEVIGVGADEHGTGYGSALQARGDVRRIAHRRVFCPDLVADSGEHREPGIDADAHVEVDPIVSPDHFRVFFCRCLDGQSRAYRALRVVFVCNRRAEKRKNRIAEQPRDSPTVFRYRCVEEGKCAVHDLRKLFGIKPLRHYGRADHVREQYRHVFAFAVHPSRGFELVAAVQAEPRARGIGGLAVGAVHLSTTHSEYGRYS